MTKYICKCGRVVAKNTTADNTGNRDTAGCEGCPYLLPWGPMVWDDQQKGYTQDVKGYECRMSPTLEYASTYHGRADDKCSLHIVSLDLDFLDEVQAWIYDNAAYTLRAGFSRGSIRGIEFSDKGRYSLSVLCAPNKKGVAAKAALVEHFFGPDKHRLDMTPQQEKAHILAAIEAGKARAKESEKTVEYIIALNTRNNSTCAYFKGEFWFWDTRVGKWLVSQHTRDIYDGMAKKVPGLRPEDTFTQDGFRELEDWDMPSAMIEALIQCDPKKADASPCETCRCPECSDDDCPQAHCDKSDGGMGCMAPDEDCPTENPTDAAPAFPADAGAATQSLSAAEPASLAAESAQPAFDYSGLDDQTVSDLHLAEREYAGGKKMAEMGLRRMADAVAIAHDAVVANCENGKDGKFKAHEDTFLSWCASIGLKKDAAYRMLQVSKLMDNSSPREQKVLEELSPSLLYAAAKPSAPAELVQAVKDGDITTHKQYQEAMAQLKAEREAREKAESDLAAVKHEADLDRKERDDANAVAMRYKAECDRRAAEQQRVEGLLATRENQLRELEKSQTVVAGTADPEEIERRAQEIAQAKIAESDAKWAEITENQGRKLRELLANSGASQAVKTAAASVQTILDGLFQALSLEEDDVAGQAALEDLEDLLFDWSDSIHNMLHPEDTLGYPPDDEEGDTDDET